jgi:hypothetical protein
VDGWFASARARNAGLNDEICIGRERLLQRGQETGGGAGFEPDANPRSLTAETNVARNSGKQGAWFAAAKGVLLH